MATQSSILAWEIPGTEEPGGLQFMGTHRVRLDLLTKQQQQQHTYHSFFRFIPHIGHYRLSRVPCAIQEVLITYLFYV